jgi:beta-lactam-binding protein with PASTA domain
MLVTVPSLVGLPEPAALAALTAAGLTLGMVTTTPPLPVGHVLAQAPMAGAQVAPGTPVALTVQG